MSFLSDIGSFLGEAQQFREELSLVKDDVVSSVVTAATSTSTTVTDTVQAVNDDMATNARDIQQSANTIISEIKQPSSNNDQ